MSEIFRLRVPNRAIRCSYRLNLDIPIINQVDFGNKSVRSFGPKILQFSPASHHVLQKYGNIQKSYEKLG